MICQRCGLREGTMALQDEIRWAHGFVENWCEHCIVTVQLAHARQRTAETPRLEARLKELDRMER